MNIKISPIALAVVALCAAPLAFANPAPVGNPPGNSGNNPGVDGSPGNQGNGMGVGNAGGGMTPPPSGGMTPPPSGGMTPPPPPPAPKPAPTKAKEPVAGAYVGGSQSSTYGVALAGYNAANKAIVDGTTMEGATGNIGANVASGLMNQQANTVAIASNTNIDDHAADSAEIRTGQKAAYRIGVQGLTGQNKASVNGNAFYGASGNLNLNDTAGMLNQQRNSMALSEQAQADGDSADSFTSQSNTWGASLQAAMTNYARLSGDSFQGAKGRIGVNVASGIGNQQDNNLSVANANNNDGEGSSYYGATANVSINQAQQYVLPIQLGLGILTGNGEGWYYKFVGVVNHAEMGSTTLYGASGDIGANIAAGAMNQQDNSTAIANYTDYGNNHDVASAGFGVSQKSGDIAMLDSGVTDVSVINGQTGQDASGNIGVNMAAGTANQQANGLALAHVASNNVMGSATAPVMQSVAYEGGATVGSSYDAGLQGSSFAGATGNIGVNVAAGNGNQQANVLAIASAAK